MVDPFSIVGVSYPIARELLTLTGKMKSAYQGIRHAKQDLHKVIKKTKTVGRTYEFFSDIKKNAKSMEELAPMFKRLRKLIARVKKESKRITRRLQRMTRIFDCRIAEEPVNCAEKWKAQFEWFIQSKKVVPNLFQDMKALEKSMRTIGILVNIQMLRQAYSRDRSDPILAQLNCSIKMLGIEVNKLQHAQPGQNELLMQSSISPNQHIEPNYLVQDILKILKEEIPQLHPI